MSEEGKYESIEDFLNAVEHMEGCANSEYVSDPDNSGFKLKTGGIVEAAANIKPATGPNIEKLIRALSDLDTAGFRASGIIIHPAAYRKCMPWIKGRNVVYRLKRIKWAKNGF